MGSAAPQGEDEWVWEDEVQAAKDRSTDDRERQILDRAIENKGVLREDYIQTLDEWQECMESHGSKVEIVYDSDGLATYEGENDPEAVKICDDGRVEVISLYNSIMLDPNKDQDERYEECLVSTGAKKKGTDLEDNGYPTDADGTIILPDEIFDEVQECMAVSE